VFIFEILYITHTGFAIKNIRKNNQVEVNIFSTIQKLDGWCITMYAKYWELCMGPNKKIYHRHSTRLVIFKKKCQLLLYFIVRYLLTILHNRKCPSSLQKRQETSLLKKIRHSTRLVIFKQKCQLLLYFIVRYLLTILHNRKCPSSLQKRQETPLMKKKRTKCLRDYSAVCFNKILELCEVCT
jgi:hypothetical protein